MSRKKPSAAKFAEKVYDTIAEYDFRTRVGVMQLSGSKIFIEQENGARFTLTVSRGIPRRAKI